MEPTAVMKEMMAECHFHGAGYSRKYYGVYFKCVRWHTGYKWYAEGQRITEKTMIKATAQPEVK